MPVLDCTETAQDTFSVQDTEQTEAEAKSDYGADTDTIQAIEPSGLRNLVRTLSLSGMTDRAILSKFPELKDVTLRQWRNRDPAWKAAFAVNTANTTAKAQTEAVTNERNGAVTKAVLQTNLVEIHASTATKLAHATAKVLGKFAAKPAPVKSWQDASVAYKVQRLATGVDREGTEVKVNLAMFSGEAAPEQGPVWEVDGEQNIGENED